jgi:acetyl esterase
VTRPLLSLSVLLILFLTVLASCEEDDLPPVRSKPEWAPDMDDDMLTVIQKFQSYEAPPIPTLTVQQARSAPSLMKAAKDVMRDKNIPPVEYHVKEVSRTIDGPEPGGLIVRVYTPQNDANDDNGPLPVIVYYHGGGWVIANLDVYESSAKALSQKANAIVISVEYRKAPKNKFPAAHEDSYAAYKWARVNAGILNGDTARVAVAGESAGGNMAGAICLMARERSFPMPVHQLLIYPIADNDMSRPSYHQYRNAKPLDSASVTWFADKYFNDPSDGDNPWISLVDADVTGLPPATIIGAEIDPLQSEGKAYADKLSGAGIDVLYKKYPGVTHEFFGLTEVLSDARDAQDVSASRLKDTFKKD